MDPDVPRRPEAAPAPRHWNVKPRDRLLVEWVADAAVGERVPEPWGWARSPTRSVILTLVSLGVIEPPAPGADMGAVVTQAAAAARSWLERHPTDAGPLPR